MKFEGSNWEERLNEFWNKEVVTQYTKLIDYLNPAGFFKPELPTSQTLLKKYSDNLMNVINNFNRVKEQFTDSTYLANYLATTQQAGINDLEEFKGLLVRHFKEDALDSILSINKTLEVLGKKAPSEQTELLDDVNSSVYYYF